MALKGELSMTDRKFEAVLYQISTMANETSDDFFQEFFENRGSKIFCVIFSCITICAIFVFGSSIIWFEKYMSDAKSTFINHMITSMTWSFLAYYGICSKSNRFIKSKIYRGIRREVLPESWCANYKSDLIPLKS